MRLIDSACAMLLTFVLVGCSDSSTAVAAPTPCSVAMLKGTYGLQRNGQLRPGAQFTAIGLIRFDGLGKRTWTQTTSTSGVFGSDSNQVGTYIVNADCTGSEFDASNNQVSTFVVVHDADEVLGMSTGGGNVAQHYERIPGPCTLASIAGDYGFQRNGTNGTGAALTAIGTVTFDGRGSSSFQQLVDRGGTITTATGTAYTYTVNSDCTSVQFDPNGAAFAGVVIVNGGDEVLGMSLTPGNNVVVHYERMKQP